MIQKELPFASGLAIQRLHLLRGEIAAFESAFGKATVNRIGFPIGPDIILVRGDDDRSDDDAAEQHAANIAADDRILATLRRIRGTGKDSLARRLQILPSLSRNRRSR